MSNQQDKDLLEKLEDWNQQYYKKSDDIQSCNKKISTLNQNIKELQVKEDLEENRLQTLKQEKEIIENQLLKVEETQRTLAKLRRKTTIEKLNESNEVNDNQEAAAMQL